MELSSEQSEEEVSQEEVSEEEETLESPEDIASKDFNEFLIDRLNYHASKCDGKLDRDKSIYYGQQASSIRRLELCRTAEVLLVKSNGQCGFTVSGVETKMFANLPCANKALVESYVEWDEKP